MPIFSGKRHVLEPSASGVGRLRMSAKRITGTGVVEPTPGWLYCNGATVARAAYKALFDEIGTTYNTGGEAGTDFRLPDFRGRFCAGQLDGGGAVASRVQGLALGTVAGAESVALTAGQIPPHSHGVGTLAVSTASGTDGQHTPNHYMPTNGSDASGAYNMGRNQTSVDWNAPVAGTISPSTHVHPSLTGSVENGAADGLASAAHQNVHPHQAFGGVLIAY